MGQKSSTNHFNIVLKYFIILRLLIIYLDLFPAFDGIVGRVSELDIFLNNGSFRLYLFAIH